MLISTTLFIGLIPDAINLDLIKSGLFFTFLAKKIEQFSVFTFTLKISFMFSLFSLWDKSMSFTFLSYIAPTSYAIPNMLNRSPLFAVNSKSITWSFNFIYAIGSSPIGASSGNSCIPALSSSVKNLLSKPSSAIEHIIPFETSPLIFPHLIVPPGNWAPSNATITLIPFLAFGAPQTISSTSFPTFTLQQCKWSESGCSLHSTISPITNFVAFTNFSAESYSFPAFVIASAISFTLNSLSKSI